MKYTTSQIKLNNKAYEATKVDFDSYSTETGTIKVDNKELSAIKVIGNESTSKILKCSNSVRCSNSTIVS